MVLKLRISPPNFIGASGRRRIRGRSGWMCCKRLICLGWGCLKKRRKGCDCVFRPCAEWRIMPGDFSQSVIQGRRCSRSDASNFPGMIQYAGNRAAADRPGAFRDGRVSDAAVDSLPAQTSRDWTSRAFVGGKGISQQPGDQHARVPFKTPVSDCRILTAGRSAAAPFWRRPLQRVVRQAHVVLGLQ